MTSEEVFVAGWKIGPREVDVADTFINSVHYDMEVLEKYLPVDCSY